jgi:hypothetical protein
MQMLFGSENPSEFFHFLGKKGDGEMGSPIQISTDYRSRASINNTTLLFDCANAGPFTCAPLDCHH